MDPFVPKRITLLQKWDDLWSLPIQLQCVCYILSQLLIGEQYGEGLALLGVLVFHRFPHFLHRFITVFKLFRILL